jgi:hypothetical protein
MLGSQINLQITTGMPLQLITTTIIGDPQQTIVGDKLRTTIGDNLPITIVDPITMVDKADILYSQITGIISLMIGVTLSFTMRKTKI